MKNYNVMFDVGQEVYIISNKSIFKSKVDKIRITEQLPYSLINGSQESREDAESGIVIEYLVVVETTNYGSFRGSRIDYDWYNQRDVFAERDEVISRIK